MRDIALQDAKGVNGSDSGQASQKPLFWQQNRPFAGQATSSGDSIAADQTGSMLTPMPMSSHTESPQQQHKENQAPAPRSQPLKASMSNFGKTLLPASRLFVNASTIL